MNKYKLSEKQYKIIRAGLERLYYNYKDEGDKDGMDAITELEKSLIQQSKKIDAEQNEMHGMIHDCYCDCIGEEPNEDIIENIARRLPEDIKADAEQFGWDDTEIGDRIWEWINRNIKS